MTNSKKLKYKLKALIAILFQLLGPHFRWMMIKTLNNALFKKNSDLFYIFEWSGLTGVFGSFLMVLFNIRMLEKFKIPMYINSENHYYAISVEKKTDSNNIWSRYFQQPFAKKLFKDRNTTIKPYLGGNKLLTFLYECSLPKAEYNVADMVKLSPLFKRYIKLSNKTSKYVNKKISKIINPKDIVLGVSIRHGYVVAKPTDHKIQPDMPMLIGDIKKLLKSYMINKILVVCDNQKPIAQLKKVFGDLIVSINRPRIDDQRYLNRSTVLLAQKNAQVQGCEKKLLDFADFGRKNEIDKKANEYISEIYALARCNHLLAGKSSGSAAAVVINGGKYKTAKLYELGTY